MIQANELRIGNWVHYLPHKKNYKVQLINDDLTDCEHIPLTPEILEKCGFVVVEDLGDMIYYQLPNQKHGFGISLDHEEWVFYYFNIGGCTTLIYDEKHFQYLHQLQNLYFALTGNELDINL